MENLSFFSPTKIFYEPDSSHKIGSLVRTVGQRIVLFTLQSEFKNEDDFAIIKTSLDKHGQGCLVYDDIESTPHTEQIDTAAHQLKRSHCDIIVAYGGWETFNIAKVLSLLATNELFCADLLSQTKQPKKDPLPVCTIPNVPSMGEEVAPHFAALESSGESHAYMHDLRLFPTMVYLDPKILVGLPVDELVRGGVATLASSVETILNKKSNEITNTMALRSLELVAKNLPLIHGDPTSMSAISNISQASVLSGLAYGSSYLGLCYGVALSLMHHSQLDIGTSMGIILPHMMEFYLTASPAKYVQIARYLGEDISDISVIEAAIKAVEGVRKLYLEINFPQRLSDFSISKADLPQIASMASQYDFLKYAPRALNRNEIETILIAAY